MIFSGLAATASGQSTRPNIILFLVDDQSWNGTSVRMDPDVPNSASDYYRTPALEELASRGMRFSNAYSAGSVCTPTRAAIQTGMSPAQLHMTDIIQSSNPVIGFEGLPLTPPIQREVPTGTVGVAQRVRDSGGNYLTAHFGKWHVQPSEYALGFDVAVDPPTLGPTVDPGGVFSKVGVALDYLDARAADNRPFFMELDQFAVHIPIEARPEVVAEYEALPRGAVHTSPQYAAFTQDLDLSLGMLMDRLEQNGQLDNTYIIYASDNGARDVDSRNFPLFGFKAALWEGGIRTPMVIAGPGITGGSVSDVPVISNDLYSTISALAGNSTPLPSAVEGADLSPLLFNDGQLPAGMEHLVRQHAEGGAIYWHQPHNQAVEAGYRIRPMSAVRDGDYKLVRIDGENGQPASIYLFDLSQTLSESENVNSSLNLANQLPAVRDALLGKLDRWLDDVDASLAYDVKAPVDIRWRADMQGPRTNEWRSITDVRQRQRETWYTVAGENPTASTAIDTYQSGLSDRALVFTGGNRLAHFFFHVGNDTLRQFNSRFPTGTPDFDRSATFEFWIKVNNTTGEQMIFETGLNTAGLSLTMGDADGNGSFNDLRARIVGTDGNSVTATAALNQFADPTKDFVQVQLVYDDSNANRGLKMYVNGAEFASAAGPATSLNWDGYDYATIGGSPGVTVGGSGGSGPLPFRGTWFRGQMAEFSFLNTALSAEDVRLRYSSKLDATNKGVVGTAGDVGIPYLRPGSVARGQMVNLSGVSLLQERTDRLAANLSVDTLVGATGGPITQSSGIIGAGTTLTSYLLHVDTTDTSAAESWTGDIQFAERIVGIIFSSTRLAATDKVLGSVGAYDLGARGLNLAENGLIVDATGTRLSFDFDMIGAQYFDIRVLTSAAAGLAGDFNLDGTVDAADYTVWRDGRGTVYTQSDYDAWKFNFGRTASASLVAGAVPEPTSILLMGVAMAAIAVGRRARRA